MARQQSLQSKSSAAAAPLDERGAGASFPIVGVGASAGGLEAFTQLLKAMPLDTGMGFVLVQHLDPEHESALTQILSRATKLPVCDVKNEQPVEPNHVYVIPPDTSLTIEQGALKLQPRPRARKPHRPIDGFFESLAQDQRARAIGVVLSGTATDGTLGLEAIKAEGGITFAQDDSAKHDSMPRSAVAAGCVDLVLSPAQIATELGRIAKHPYGAGQPLELSMRAEQDRAEATAHEDDKTPLPSGGRTPPTGAKRARAESTKAAKTAKSAEDGYKKILLLLRNHSGVDFSLYKSTTIQRRITRRLVLSKQNKLDDYASFLRGNTKELDALYSDVLISVTSFFRNPEMFDALQREVLPRLLKQRGDDPIRVWVLGCSTGQEAYSIAIAFVEAAEKAPRMRSLQIFATDLNDTLLDKARHGLYATTLADDISPQRLRRFFVEEEGGYRVSKMLREMVVFARQNLIADPPFSRMDLISCRNLLIYLEPTLQKKALPTFHYALKPDGFLLLGASESIGGFTDLFEPVDRKYKIYSKKPAPTPPSHLPLTREHAAHVQPQRPSLPARQQAEPVEPVHSELNVQREADRVIVNQFAPPGVLINDQLQVLQFRGPTGAYLQPPAGKASFDVLKMAREGLMLPLRAAINQARKENKTARKQDVGVRRNGTTRLVNLEVIPLKNLRERCFLIIFKEAEKAGRAPLAKVAKSSAKTDRRSAKQSSHIVELEAELSETREYLRSLQEEHEAANEELQASNEEVQSANEELQSINEELETSKEELESANEELITVNEEMSNRNIELNRLNNDLVNLQTSTKLAIVLLGRELTIRRFSPQAAKQFDLLASDVGRPIGHLRHNLVAGYDTGEESPLHLESLAAEVIASVREQEREVRDKSGHWHLLRVRPYMTLDNKIDGAVLVLVDIDALKTSEHATAAARHYAENTVETVREPLLVLDKDLRVESANRSFYRMFRVEPRGTIGKLIYDLGNHQWNIPRLRELLEEILPQKTTIEDFRVEHDFESIGPRIVLLNARQIRDPAGETQLILLAIEDITMRMHDEETSARLAAIVTSSEDAVVSKDLNGVIKTWNRGAEHLFGYMAEEAIGKPVTMLIPDDLLDEETEILRRIRSGESVEHYETVRRHKDGSLIDISLTVSPLRDGTGRIIGASKIARDITHLKRAQDELRESDRRKSEFLATLAHELRNPLAPIRNAVQVLRRTGGSSENVLAATEMMERQVGHMVRLVDDLLDISRISHGRIELRKEWMELASVIHHAVEATRPLAECGGIDLTVALPPQPMYVNADPTRLAQVLENLLNNACKFSSQSGGISMHVSKEGEQAVIRVRDAGIGIATDQLARIFDMFTQVDTSLERPVSGLGIGLSLVKGLVEMHGGTVEAHSAGVGHGSEFIVRLPLVSEGSKPQSPEPTVSELTPTTPRRILVVDDNRDSAESLALLLKLAGHETHTVFDGVEAVQAAGTFKPDVVLLDIGLPKLNGYEVARRLREQPSANGIMLIALTGWGQEEDRQRSRGAGFNAHMVKPVDLDALNKLLAETLSVESQ